MRIRWTAPAAADLEHIRAYLHQHHPQFAQPTVLKIFCTSITVRRIGHRRPGGRLRIIASIGDRASRDPGERTQ